MGFYTYPIEKTHKARFNLFLDDVQSNSFGPTASHNEHIDTHYNNAQNQQCDLDDFLKCLMSLFLSKILCCVELI